MNRKTREKWIRDMIRGEGDVTAYQDVLREQAKTLYPGAAELLNTRSLRQVLDPYLAAAAQELGIPPEQMNLKDPKWTTALTGKNGVMTLDEWQRTYRSDKRFGWDKSAVAKSTAASLTSDLARMMGNGF